MKLSIFVSNIDLKKHVDEIVNRNEKEELMKIDTSKIAKFKIRDLEKFKTEGLDLLNQQLGNIKAIDDRAMKLMAAMGIVFSLAGALVVSIIRSEPSKPLPPLPIVLLSIAFFFTSISLTMCLAIIQSIKISPPGYVPNVRLRDISENYSQHEMELEYLLSISRRNKRNDEIIDINGRRFHVASSLWFISILVIIICFSTLSYI